jgi:hypothetical protein
MSSDLYLSLQITALGMGLVFGAIIVLWGMMQALARLTADKEPAALASEPSLNRQPEGHGEPDHELRARAAAAAVALALAEQEASSAHPLNMPPTALVSAWQLGMRTRQMYEKGSHR